MIKKLLFVLCLLSLPLASAVMAQDNNNPTVAILRFGEAPTVLAVEQGIMDILQSHGFINAEEREIITGVSTPGDRQRIDLEGEHINIIWGDANYDLSALNLIIDQMLDQDLDALVTISTPATQAAVNATTNIEEPPALLFTAVYNPYRAGIANAPCIKPDYITGSVAVTPYEDIVPLVLLQDPDIKTIGTIYNSSESSAHYGAEQIVEAGQALGLTVEVTAVTSLADLSLAAEGLISKGIEAFLLPVDLKTALGIPIIGKIAEENGVPIFHAGIDGIFGGTTASAGFYLYFDQGISVGRILTAYLKGDIDIATTGISIQTSGINVGVNLDAAAAQGVEISEELYEIADLEINVEQNFSLKTESAVMEYSRIYGEKTLGTEEQLAADGAFLETLVCTPERIAQEQAELDAGE